MVALRPVLADVLAELTLAQELDEAGAEEQADEQRRRAAEQDPPHQRRREAPAGGASAAEDVLARCAQQLRDPLQPDSPRALHEHRVAPAQQRREQLRRRLGVRHRIGLTGELDPHLRRQRADGHEQVDTALAGIQPDLAV